MSKKQKQPAPKPKAAVQPKQFNWASLISYGIIAVVAFALYAKTLGFDFVYHDDDTMIINNTVKLQNADFKTIFLTDAWFRTKEIELYRPWQSLTYVIDYKIWETNPTGYHLHNLLVFIAGLLLLYVFLQKINFTERWALLLTVFYACHYLFAHTVSWIPARGDLYLTVFGLAAAIQFLNYMRKPNAKALVWAYVFFFLALLAKETAIVVLPAILFLRWAELNFNFKQIKNILGLWLLPALFPLTVFFALRQASIAQMPYVSFTGGIYNLPVIPESVFKFFVPYAFCVLPGYTAALTIAGSVLLVLMAVAVFALFKTDKRNLLIAGFVMFLLTLFPSLFYKPNFSGFAYDYLDHRMFFAGIGLLIFTGTLLRALPLHEKAIHFLLIGICVLEAVFSFTYQNAYRDYHSYYENGMRNNPKSALAMLNYGILLRVRENKYEESIAVLNKGIQAYPDSTIFISEKGGNYFKMGKIDSLLAVSNALAKYPQAQYEALTYKAIYYSNKNMPDSAYMAFTQAIAANPKKPDAYYNRSKVIRGQNNLTAALGDLDEALRLDVNYADAYFERGNVFGNLGYFDKAASDFEKYVQLKPDNPDAYFYLGQAYILSNKKVLGCQTLQKAVDLGQPDAAAKINQLCR